jgi:hypothetical protein
MTGRGARLRPAFLLAALLAGVTLPGRAGGPIAVGGGFGADGVPFKWSTASPISYRVDSSGLGTLSNADAVTRTAAMFQVWTDVTTAAISYTNGGTITGVANGDVATLADYNTVNTTCNDGTQSPVVFDADGSIFDSLFGVNNRVIGFAGPCQLSSNNIINTINTGKVAMNGQFIDGVTNEPSNPEISSDGFDAAIIHEIGHFSGLDHAQINVNCIGSCPAGDQGGVPTMFPLLVGDFMKTLGTDDISWISNLYPTQPAFGQGYGTVSGIILLSNGSSQAEGVNVIARLLVDNVPSRVQVFSVVSGYRYTDGGGTFGADDPNLRGVYEIALPPGDYSIEVEEVASSFTGGSSVGPFDPPKELPGGIPEYYSGGSESNSDDPNLRTAVTITAGGTTSGINIILNTTSVKRRGQTVSE